MKCSKMSKSNLSFQIFAKNALLVPFKSQTTTTHKQLVRFRLAISLTSVLAGLKKLNPFTNKSDRSNTHYWTCQTIPDIVEEADQLFLEEKFLEVYELLSRPKYSNVLEVQWRIGRALYKMASKGDAPQNTRKEMIEEAYVVLHETIKEGKLKRCVGITSNNTLFSRDIQYKGGKLLITARDYKNPSTQQLYLGSYSAVRRI